MELVLMIAFFLLIFAFRFYKAKIKGIIGEKTVSSILRYLDKSDYIIINNVLLKIGETTSQIDHIVISSFGIFVIETKNYKGWIVGNENSKYWTQVLYKYKTKFYNPIFQNEGHIRVLKKCLNDSNLQYISIIVFSAKAEIKVNTNTNVINTYNLLRTIAKYTSQNLSQEEKLHILNKIKGYNVTGSSEQRQHINSIKKRINNQNHHNTIEEKKCPQCGNNMIERSGQFGKFLGCKSYPKCKFTRRIIL